MRWSSLLSLWVLSCYAQAEIYLSDNQPLIPNANHIYQIEQKLGQTKGHNLFHSFDRFNIDTGEIASFSGSEQIQNIIARVSGDQTSFINGQLHSSIPKANLYLLNPNGIILGAQAELALTGHFYATTADFIQFDDNHRFYATPNQNELLSMASVSSFGFLNAEPAPIHIFRDASNPQNLQFESQQNIALLGGDILLKGAPDNTLVGLDMTEGQIFLASLAGQGQVSIIDHNVQISDNIALGDIVLTDNFSLSVTGQQGKIIARAKNFTLSNQATITADGQLLDIQADTVLIENASKILTDNYFTAPNQAGTIKIQARDIQLDSGGQIYIFNDNLNRQGGLIDLNAERITIAGESNNTLTSIMTRSTNSGSTGSIDLKAKQLAILDGANISTTAYARGQGGALNIQVTDSVVIQGESQAGYPSTVSANTEGSGQAGQIYIETAQLRILDGGSLTASTSDIGQGGVLNLNITDTLLIQGERQDGFPSVIDASSYGTGAAGHLVLNANKINILNGGLAGAGTFESGEGGLVSIVANEINIEGKRTDNVSSMIATGTYGDEDAGNLSITAQQLNLGSGGMIATSAFAAGKGRAGDLFIDVQQLNLRDNGQINANSLTSGGDMTLSAKGIYLQNSRIESQLAGELIFDSLSSGGNLHITATDYIVLDNSQITASSELASGNGGNLTLSTQFIIANHGSQLQARAFQGHGGNINIDIFGLFKAGTMSNQQLFDASSELGISGETNIQLDTVVDIQYGLLTLPKTFLTHHQAFELCGTTRNQSHFIFHPYTGSKYSVFDWRPSPTSHLLDF